MDTFSDEMNPSDDLYSLSREKSLALKMQKRETLRNLSTLRKVHSNKVKLERNKVKEMAHQMIKNKASNLKDLCFSEIKSIVNQYNRLLDTTQNLFYNEGKWYTFIIQQENILVQRMIVEDLISKLGRAFENNQLSSENYGNSVIQNDDLIDKYKLLKKENEHLSKQLDILKNEFEIMKQLWKASIEE